MLLNLIVVNTTGVYEPAFVYCDRGCRPTNEMEFPSQETFIPKRKQLKTKINTIQGSVCWVIVLISYFCDEIPEKK